MRKYFLLSMAVLMMLPGLPAQTANSATARTLTAMLNQFLRDAGTNNAPGFDRFFADELIYTGSNGRVQSKADIMRSLKGPQPPAPAETYSAEHVVVREFGDTAVLAFQLVARTHGAGGQVTVSNYRDTGTFLFRNGRWQVIAWQATKMAGAQ